MYAPIGLRTWSKFVSFPAAETGFGIRLALFGVSLRCTADAVNVFMGIGFLNVELGVCAELGACEEFVHFTLRMGESGPIGVPNSGRFGEGFADELDERAAAAFRKGLILEESCGTRESGDGTASFWVLCWMAAMRLPCSIMKSMRSMVSLKRSGMCRADSTSLDSEWLSGSLITRN